jgi:Holliday junction DNA helicase RuvA
MIGYLSGTASGRVVLTPAGVGYVVNTPRPLLEGKEVELHVSTVVREDAITLYAFEQEGERLAFEALCKVNGVGPTSALAILRDAGLAGLLAAVSAKDVRLLGKVKGVGPKIAERVVHEIQLPHDLKATCSDSSAVENELVNVLIGLGFDLTEALKAIATTDPSADEDVRLAAALTHLRRDNR